MQEIHTNKYMQWKCIRNEEKETLYFLNHYYVKTFTVMAVYPFAETPKNRSACIGLEENHTNEYMQWKCNSNEEK